AMYTDANSLFPVIEDAQKSKVVGKVGYALFPRGPKGQYGSTVASWGLAMPKSSKNQKAAWLFMQWATAREQVLAVQSEKGVLGARESVWKDPKGLTKVPADLRESLTVGSKVGTPLWNPPVVAVAECRDAIGAAIVTVLQLVLGVALALLLNRPFRGKGLVRSIFLLPMVATPVAIALVWMMMYNPTLGVMNYLVGLAGLGPYKWVSNAAIVVPALAVVDTWEWTPLITLIT